jgi:hypothetical protein
MRSASRAASTMPARQRAMRAASLAFNQQNVGSRK